MMDTCLYMRTFLFLQAPAVSVFACNTGDESQPDGLVSELWELPDLDKSHLPGQNQTPTVGLRA